MYSVTDNRLFTCKVSRFIQNMKWPASFLLLASLCLIPLLPRETGGMGKALFQSAGEIKVTTVYLVRHAEKAAEPAADPPLLEAGTKRSEELARKLGNARIKTIYTSQYLRTKQTAEPLAKQLGIAVTIIPVKMSATNPRELSQEYLTEMAERVYSNPGGSVLIVGHSNTIPEIIKALGVESTLTIEDTVFDDLFIVHAYARGKASMTRLKQ